MQTEYWKQYTGATYIHCGWWHKDCYKLDPLFIQILEEIKETRLLLMAKKADDLLYELSMFSFTLNVIRECKYISSKQKPIVVRTSCIDEKILAVFSDQLVIQPVKMIHPAFISSEQTTDSEEKRQNSDSDSDEELKPLDEKTARWKVNFEDYKFNVELKEYHHELLQLEEYWESSMSDDVCFYDDMCNIRGSGRDAEGEYHVDALLIYKKE